MTSKSTCGQGRGEKKREKKRLGKALLENGIGFSIFLRFFHHFQVASALPSGSIRSGATFSSQKMFQPGLIPAGIWDQEAP